MKKECNHSVTKVISSTHRKRSGEIISIEMNICEKCKEKISEGNILETKKIFI